MFYLGMVTVIILFCVLDFKQVSEMFREFIEWVRLHPFKAIGAINFLYAVCLVFTLPITFNHIMLGFTYSQVFHSKIEGLIFTIPVVMSGVLLGSVLSFLLSRFFFKDLVRQ